MIVGVVGFIGSGKNTVAKYLSDEKNFQTLSFAEPLKEMVSIVFGWDKKLLDGLTDESRSFREMEDDWWSEKLGKRITPRFMLQYMGTEVFRNTISKEIWIHVLDNKINRAGDKNIVIPDVRFPNEIQFIRKKGGKIIRVLRGKEPEWYETALEDNLNGTNNMKKYYSNVHDSEWAWIGEKFDCEIENNSDLNCLKIKVDDFIKKGE